MYQCSGTDRYQFKNNNQMIFDFEKESSEWEMENAELSTQEHKNGSSSLLLKNGYAMIPVTGIEQGSYTVSMWVKEMHKMQNSQLEKPEDQILF